MKKQEIIALGKSLGLQHRPESYDQNQPYVVFDGVNGQRFVFYTAWSEAKTHAEMGAALINIGKRTKAMQLQQILSITNDV